MARDDEIERVEAILHQIIKSGVAEESLLDQMDKFERGIQHTVLARPCTIGDGIKVIDPEEFEGLLSEFNEAAESGRVTKFVPASGAASRMFKSLIGYMVSTGSANEEVDEAGQNFGSTFIDSLGKFAFYEELSTVLKRDGLELSQLVNNGGHATILQYVLTGKGLNYANLPKGLILFHRAREGARSAFLEHLAEAVHYATDREKIARVHFTVPPEHQEAIEEHIAKGCVGYEAKGIHFEVTYSTQKESSQTIAVDMDNEPFRTEGELLVFRPAGHGALLENLNDLQGDIVFIKNIDNVVPDHLKHETYLYKKLLGGYLTSLQKCVFAALLKLERPILHNEDLESISEFACTQLGISLPADYGCFDDTRKQEYLYGRLHRPLRVCGMVKNMGEPGGGPFWLSDDECSLQIVESAQVDMDNSEQKAIFDSSTHFNPVDLVCGVRDHKGKPYKLMEYVDMNLGLISCKSKGGKELKALELPGLWNGSMAYWNTIFIEVPLITFNPVKTVNDLLRDEHQ